MNRVTANLNMHLAEPSESRLRTLFSWFDTNQSVSVWGGPDMRLPMTLETLKADARLDTLASRFLLNHDNVAVGFGQFYQRINHCHLGRLVIAPEQRGNGLGDLLIEKLSDEGRRALKLGTQSLFVLTENQRAKRLYERLGFAEAPYPDNDVDMADLVYMIRTTR